MNIDFSRHAQRRMKLYHIDASDAQTILGRSNLPQAEDSDKIILVDNSYAQKYRSPLKIVATVEQTRVLVVTVYPLKKGLQP
jgi:hypothetical protein